MTTEQDPDSSKRTQDDASSDGAPWISRCSNCGTAYLGKRAGRCGSCGQHLDPRTGLGVVEAHRKTPNLLISLRNGSIWLGLVLPALGVLYAVWVLVDGWATFGGSSRIRPSSGRIRLVGMTATLWALLILVGALTTHAHYFWSRVKPFDGGCPHRDRLRFRGGVRLLACVCREVDPSGLHREQDGMSAQEARRAKGRVLAMRFRATQIAGALALNACSISGCASLASSRETATSSAFPADWTGRWTGTIATLGDSKLAPVAMMLEIAPIADGRWSWTIIYEGEAGRQIRPYELIAVDARTGRFAIDEKNGIVIPARVLEGTLYSTFEVMGSRIELRETLVGTGRDATLSVEMATIAVEDATVTGGIEAQAIPEVRAWTPRVVQRGTLRRN